MISTLNAKLGSRVMQKYNSMVIEGFTKNQFETDAETWYYTKQNKPSEKDKFHMISLICRI